MRPAGGAAFGKPRRRKIVLDRTLRPGVVSPPSEQRLREGRRSPHRVGRREGFHMKRRGGALDFSLSLVAVVAPIATMVGVDR